ncbi:MAG: matrixin family metalloprotease [Kofleriaceae bacterium]
MSALLIAAPAPATAYDLAASSAGDPVHWAAGDITITLAIEPGPPELDPDAAVRAVTAAVATWQAALVDSSISIALAGDPAAPATHTNDGVLTLRWAFDADDPDLEPGLLGQTFLAYRTGDAQLVDADIVLNANDFVWTTDPTSCANEYDVESAVTHELGHALGLAHSIGHPEATMFATGDACDVAKRDLSADDTEGLDELYAPPPSETGGCTTSGPTGAGALALVFAGLLLTRQRARHRKSA